MGSWVHGFIGSWVHGFMGSWVHRFIGSWVHGFMGSWVHGLFRPPAQCSKSIGFTVYFAFLTPKSDFQWGHTVRKMQNHWNSIGFIDKVLQKRPSNRFGPRNCSYRVIEKIWRTLTDKLFREKPLTWYPLCFLKENLTFLKHPSFL